MTRKVRRVEVGEEKQTSVPKSPLRKRVLYRLFRWCGLTTYNIEQALRNRFWTGIQLGAKKSLGHCPHHPGEPLQEREHGYFVCSLCNNALLWPSDLEERHSDKLPATLAQDQPGLLLFDYRQKHHNAGPETQTHRSVRTVKLSPDRDRRL